MLHLPVRCTEGAKRGLSPICHAWYTPTRSKELRGWEDRESYRCKQISAAMGSRMRHEITREQIDELKASEQKTKKPATVNRLLSRLSNILKTAVGWGYIKFNPSQGVTFLPERNQRNRALTRAEYKRLLKALPPGLNELVVFAANTGMRRGELLLLSWADVDLNEGVIVVRDTKNADARNVPINLEARAALEELPRNVADLKVFRWPDGNAITSFRGMWKSVCKAARVENFRFHDLRHTCATWLGQGGAEALDIKAILGHRKLEMVLRYAHSQNARPLPVADDGGRDPPGGGGSAGGSPTRREGEQ